MPSRRSHLQNTALYFPFSAAPFTKSPIPIPKSPNPNVVGYQSVVVTNGYSIFSPTFKGINPDEKMDLNSIKVLKLDGTEIPADMDDPAHILEWCGGAIYVNVMGSDGFYSATYQYYRNFGQRGWYEGETPVADNTVFIKKGQGFMVNNDYQPYSTPTCVVFQTSGEVNLEPVTTMPPGYSMYGNCTPVEIDLVDINILKLDGTEIPTDLDPTHIPEWCGGAIYLNILGQNGFYEKTYQFYRNYGKQGWYDGETPVTRGMCKLPAGKAFLINNDYIVDEVPQTMKISLPAPIDK